MFQSAEEEKAILLLDEADSFLRDRTNARHSWEITEVNEFLVQMENFNNIFIASTNLMEALDSASFRRFDFKIKFDYLLPEQVWNMFISILNGNGITNKLRHKYKSILLELTNLTPGDFTTVLRKHRILSKQLHPDLLLEDLVNESKTKPDKKKRSIGFIF